MCPSINCFTAPGHLPGTPMQAAASDISAFVPRGGPNEMQDNAKKLAEYLKPLRDFLADLGFEQAPDESDGTNHPARVYLGKYVQLARTFYTMLFRSLPWERRDEIVRMKDEEVANAIRKAMAAANLMGPPDERNAADAFSAAVALDQFRTAHAVPGANSSQTFPFPIGGSAARELERAYAAMSQAFDAVAAATGWKLEEDSAAGSPSAVKVLSNPPHVGLVVRLKETLDELEEAHALVALQGHIRDFMASFTHCLAAKPPGVVLTDADLTKLALHGAEITALSAHLRLHVELQALISVSRATFDRDVAAVFATLINLGNELRAHRMARQFVRETPPDVVRDVVDKIAITPWRRMTYFGEKLGLFENGEKTRIEDCVSKVTTYLVSEHDLTEEQIRKLDCDQIANILKADMEKRTDPREATPMALRGGPLAILREAVRAVPSLKYALGVAGIVSVVALVASFQLDFRAAVTGFVFVVAGMAIIVVFARVAQMAPRHLFVPAITVLWAMTLLFVLTAALLFASVFFAWPLKLRHWLDPATVTAEGRGRSVSASYGRTKGDRRSKGDKYI